MSEAEQQTNETLKRIQTEERAEALTPPSSPSSSR